jgi:hypothetical protein
MPDGGGDLIRAAGNELLGLPVGDLIQVFQ